MEGICDFKKLAKFLGITETALRQRRYRKQIPEPFRIGRRLYWQWKDIEAWIEEQRRVK